MSDSTRVMTARGDVLDSEYVDGLLYQVVVLREDQIDLIARRVYDLIKNEIEFDYSGEKYKRDDDANT